MLPAPVVGVVLAPPGAKEEDVGAVVGDGDGDAVPGVLEAAAGVGLVDTFPAPAPIPDPDPPAAHSIVLVVLVGHIIPLALHAQAIAEQRDA